MPKYLVAENQPQPHHQWNRKLDGFKIGDDVTEGWTQLDRSVGPVDSFIGGSNAAYKRLKEFVNNDLANYQERRNHPETDGTSRLSPYLHYGHISVISIALAVEKAQAEGKVSQETRDSFINELVGWRELAVNFTRLDPNYDKLDCAEPWALKTLREHASDSRPHLYTMEQMAGGETHDELWNAAQLQMTKFGWMHNYMRMYWAKKILEWSPNPAVAYEWAVILNDKYFLDGRDPNGYAGIAWAIAGKHDRPWFDRPIFGTIRYMSGASTGRKFNSKKYISNVTEREPKLAFGE
jgi:deoxyribodipyrimidine photo-lyase